MDGFIEFARGEPSAQQTDPIIGLSQKRIYLTLLLYSLSFQWTSPRREANAVTVNSGGRQMAQPLEPKRAQPPDPVHYAESSARLALGLTGKNTVLGRQYLTRQAMTLLNLAKTTRDPKVAAGLLDKAADLK